MCRYLNDLQGSLNQIWKPSTSSEKVEKPQVKKQITEEKIQKLLALKSYKDKVFEEIADAERRRNKPKPIKCYEGGNEDRFDDLQSSTNSYKRSKSEMK